MTASYVPSARPSAASSALEIVQVRLLSLLVRALDQARGQLAAERHELVVDRDRLVVVHDRRVEAVEPLGRVVQRRRRGCRR